MAKLSLITPEDLVDLVRRRVTDITIIDARHRDEYQAGHINGAVNLLWSDFCQEAPESAGEQFARPGWWGLLLDPVAAALAERLAEMGIDSDSRIIVYADGQVSKGLEGRIAWMLLYLGARDLSVLDGGFSGWLKAGGTIESREIEKDPARFELDIDGERRITMDELALELDSRSDAFLLDARSSPEFDGEVYSYLPRMGHIPKAVLFPFSSIFRSDEKRYIDRQEYLSRLADKGALSPPLAAYCELGLRAATVAFLHELYTGEPVRIFDGGYMQWTSTPAMPVASN